MPLLQAVAMPPPLAAAQADPDVLGLDAGLALPAPLEPAHRMVPRAPGTVARTTFLYGPHAIPAGWDLNRVALDVPLQDGFVTQLGYRLVDATTGQQHGNMHVHIHHALWFRGVGLDFGELVLGTGEERTHVDLDARADAAPGGPRYGLAFTAEEPHTLLLMLHNKMPQAQVVHILLDATFVYGTADAIRAATACGNAVPLEGEGCAAGQDFHALDGRLWGGIYDVPRDPLATTPHIYPSLGSDGIRYTAQASGTMVHLAGHVHPNGLATVVVNLGPAGSGCEADLDADGFPGTTLLRSAKFDRVPGLFASEEFQMGVSKPGWRAPVRAGDRIAQWGVYEHRDHASYGAMAFAASHVDRLAPPPPRTGCQLREFAPRLVGGAGDPAESVPNRDWDTPAMPVCGVAGQPPCDHPATPPPGLEVGEVLIADFAFTPGDQHLALPLGAPPRVHQGQALRFVNADTSSVVRHTVTSCPWPCNGPYVANYPQPDGRFDSGAMGNLDVLDGGGVPPRHPTWDTPTTLPAGLYSYYCRLHPWMRGAFEVVT
jgi:plastocyanin